MNELLDEISRAVRELFREDINPLAEKFALQPDSGTEITGGPLVLLLGNHSSGKSTFINHFLAEEVQRTGMAPTDDCFTVLRYGREREERDGRAVVSNPELPFAGADRFGPAFLSHFKMRSLPNHRLREVTLIDSPGLIDSADTQSDRGYDFGAVAQWFAERADLVLLLFDPDRPGTTAETLSILTRSLNGIDHKLLVVMNKMDQFRGLRDFARCYGTLCWNLGKVIRKKDMPQIYTTFVPVPGAAEPVLPLDDFARAREELVEEIRRAPVRRVDNMLTRAVGQAERVKMHAKITNRVARRLRRYRTRLYGGLAAVILAVLIAGGFLAQAELWGWAAGFVALAALAAAGGHWGIRRLLRGREKEILGDLDGVFEEVYRRDLVVGNRSEKLLSLWQKIRPDTQRILEKLGTLSLSRLARKDIQQLDACIETRVPELRAKLHRRGGGNR